MRAVGSAAALVSVLSPAKTSSMRSSNTLPALRGAASGGSAAQSGAPFGSFLGPLARARQALATDRLDEGLDVVAAVMVGDFVSRLDVLDGADLDRMLDEIDLGIGPA